DRTAAEALRGQLAIGEQADLAPLDDDEFYWHELIGFRVETLEGEVVGEVEELWETGGHDLLVIRGAAGQQLLVPTAREIMQKIDRVGRRILIDAIPGLIDGTE
ncbi:MAG: ribosome maturation factor RimM, partial [Myxococcota bacterium]